MVSRDEINEGIYRTCGGDDDDPASKDEVAKRTFDVFFSAIELLVSSGVTFVAEAAFQDWRWRIGLEPIAPAAELKIIACEVDPELARARTVRRHLDQPRPPRAHAGPQATVQAGPPRPFEPLALPAPTLRVDTTDGYDPGFAQILAFLTTR